MQRPAAVPPTSLQALWKTVLEGHEVRFPLEAWSRPVLQPETVEHKHGVDVEGAHERFKLYDCAAVSISFAPWLRVSGLDC